MWFAQSSLCVVCSFVIASSITGTHRRMFCMTMISSSW